MSGLKLSRQAFDENEQNDYDLCKAKQTETSADAFYWQKCIDLQIQLFMLEVSEKETDSTLDVCFGSCQLCQMASSVSS